MGVIVATAMTVMASGGSIYVNQVAQKPSQPVAQAPYNKQSARIVASPPLPTTELQRNKCAEPDRPNELVPTLTRLVTSMQPSLSPQDVKTTVEGKLLDDARELLHGDIAHIHATTTICVVRTTSDGQVAWSVDKIITPHDEE